MSTNINGLIRDQLSKAKAQDAEAMYAFDTKFMRFNMVGNPFVDVRRYSGSIQMAATVHDDNPEYPRMIQCLRDSGQAIEDGTPISMEFVSSPDQVGVNCDNLLNQWNKLFEEKPDGKAD
jgi:hypothetical protein